MHTHTHIYIYVCVCVCVCVCVFNTVIHVTESINKHYTDPKTWLNAGKLYVGDDEN